MREHHVPMSAAVLRSMAAVAVVASALVLTVTSASAAVSSATQPKRIGASPLIPNGAAADCALASATDLRALVALNPPAPASMAAYAVAVSTPGDSSYRQYLTPAQFATRFAPSAAQAAVVEQVLAQDGLHPGPVSPNGLSISIDGTATQFSQAFDTRFTQCRLASGRVAYATTSAPLLAGSIATTVQGIIGLDNLVEAQHKA